MKTHLQLLLSGLLSLSFAALLSAADTDLAGDAAKTGVTLKDGTAYLIRDGAAQKLDSTQVPDGQMLNLSGQVVPLPANVTGLEGNAPATATTPTNASPSTATVDATSTGVAMRGGATYLIRDGKATRLDAAALDGKQMMTFDGRSVPLPEGVTGMADAAPTESGNVTPGTVTPGRVTPGKVIKGDDVRGADVRGKDVQGNGSSNVRGGDVRGGNVTGGNVSGSNATGGSVRGGDVRGGDVSGGNATGGSVRGGDVRGGDVRGGNTSR